MNRQIVADYIMVLNIIEINIIEINHFQRC